MDDLLDGLLDDLPTLAAMFRLSLVAMDNTAERVTALEERWRKHDHPTLPEALQEGAGAGLKRIREAEAEGVAKQEPEDA